MFMHHNTGKYTNSGHNYSSFPIFLCVFLTNSCYTFSPLLVVEIYYIIYCEAKN